MRSSSRRLKRVRPLLGTYVEIELRGDAGLGELHAWIGAGFAAVEEVQRLMSFHLPDSDLSRLNRAPAGSWVDADPLTVKVLRASNDLHRLSRGAFDVRCGEALVRGGVLPPPGVPPAGAPPNGRAPVVLRAGRARKTGPWILDLGGIAKGFAVDRAARAVRRLAAGRRISGVVNAGGDLLAWGDETRAAIRIPSSEGTRLVPFALRRTAVASSSLRKPSDHVLMPSGEAAAGDRTAAVFARSCLEADALTKVVLLADPAVAARCLKSRRARGLLFGTNASGAAYSRDASAASLSKEALSSPS